MNRKIKFRGRDVITGNWAYGYYYPSKGHAIIRDENDKECIVVPETVGQYTGMDDKNWVHIYEGDIISYVIGTAMPNPKQMRSVIEYPIVQKVWNEEKATHAAFGYNSEDKGDPYYLSLFHTGDCKLEVVGNIHENQELIP